jgi:hypothetical protein
VPVSSQKIATLKPLVVMTEGSLSAKRKSPCRDAARSTHNARCNSSTSWPASKNLNIWMIFPMAKLVGLLSQPLAALRLD